MPTRKKLFIFLMNYFRVASGDKLPWYLFVIKSILFPLQTYCAFQNGIKYDSSTDIYTIEGMIYSGELFRSWAKGGIKIGEIFCLVKRENGVITIERIS